MGGKVEKTVPGTLFNTGTNRRDCPATGGKMRRIPGHPGEDAAHLHVTDQKDAAHLFLAGGTSANIGKNQTLIARKQTVVSMRR